MADERPTTLLHDGWGSPRPLTDKELARIRRRENVRNAIVLTIFGAIIAGIAWLIIWLLNIPMPR